MTNDGSPTAERKQTLRLELSDLVARLSPDAAQSAAARVADRALELPEVTQAQGILICLSFGQEVDTWGLLQRLLDLGRPVYVPRTERKDHRIHVHPYPCELRTLSFGLRQPPLGAPELDEDEVNELIGVALIVGLGFDRRGYRLGHGAGYFDRFLAGRSFPGIGLSYHQQLLDQIPTEAHDVPMAAVVTERETWRPSNG